MPGPLITCSAPSGTASVQLLAPVVGRIFLRGWAASEDTGTAPAKLQILDAQGGNLLTGITLAANESTREFIQAEGTVNEGIPIPTGGLWLVRNTGTSTAVAFYAWAG